MLGDHVVNNIYHLRRKLRTWIEQTTIVLWKRTHGFIEALFVVEQAQPSLLFAWTNFKFVSVRVFFQAWIVHLILCRYELVTGDKCIEHTFDKSLQRFRPMNSHRLPGPMLHIARMQNARNETVATKLRSHWNVRLSNSLILWRTTQW